MLAKAHAKSGAVLLGLGTPAQMPRLRGRTRRKQSVFVERRRRERVQVSEKTRSYLLVVKQTLLNTVPKAIVFHQVKQAEEHLLSAMQASVAGFEEEQLANLLGEDPAVATQRKQIRARVTMLRKAVHEISSFSG